MSHVEALISSVAVMIAFTASTRRFLKRRVKEIAERKSQPQ
jgi:hypothetical protein